MCPEQTPLFPDVSETVWNWKSSPEPVKAPRKTLKALAQASIMALAAAFLWFYLQHPIAGGVLFALAGLVLVAGLFAPPLYSLFEKAGAALGAWTARAISYLSLTLFFWLCFAPGRLIIQLRGKDPLRMKLDTQAPSYWTTRTLNRAPERYERQY